MLQKIILLIMKIGPRRRNVDVTSHAVVTDKKLADWPPNYQKTAQTFPRISQEPSFNVILVV